MSKLVVSGAISIGIIVTSLALANPGEVNVSLEASTDFSSWSAATQGVRTVSSPPAYFRASIVPVDGGEVCYSNVVEASPAAPWYNVNVSLEASSDLTNWSGSVVGLHDVSGGREFYRVRVQSIYDDMVFVEGGTMTGIIDPDTGELAQIPSFYINRYEISKEQWDVVSDWGTAQPSDYHYDFFVGLDPQGSYGIACAANHPVSKLSWYDAVKWCNARSEMEGLTPVYYTDASLNNIHRRGNKPLDDTYVSFTADGYRLPYSNEWEYAARGGALSQGYIYAGGDDPDDVAIYFANSAVAECPDESGRGTWPMASKAANELGIFDMSGNVSELVNDYEGLEGTDRRVRIRGSDYSWIFTNLLETTNQGVIGPALLVAELPSVGFRPVRPIPVPSAAAAEPSKSVRISGKPKNNKLLKASTR